MGLIGKLYYDVLPKGSFSKLKNSSHKVYINADEYFQERWLGFKSSIRGNDWVAVKNNDALRKPQKRRINAHISNIVLFEDEIQKDLNKLSEKHFLLDKDEILDNLINALENTKTYEIPTEKETKISKYTYSIEAKNRLIEHIYIDRELFELPHFIRWYIYFAVNNSVPDDFSKNERTGKDLEEFSVCVIRKYGATSKHAVREIVKLATRKNEPNVIAMYEYADMLFYGISDGIKQDMNKALEYYGKAAGIGESDIHVQAYPLALWSIAYIYLNYKNPRFNNFPSKDNIDKLEKMTHLERIEEAYKRASQAFSISKLPAAANLLGQIAQLTDNDPGCKGINAFKSKKHVKDYKEYFEIAQKGGWIYAYNNLANEELHQLYIKIGNKKEWREHIYNCILNMHKAAKLKDAYAANTLGTYYLNGIVYKNPYSKKAILRIDSDGIKKVNPETDEETFIGEIEDIEIIDPNTEKTKIVNSIINPELAYIYFKMSLESFSVFDDRYCGYSCAYLKSRYWERLTKKEQEDVNAIIERYSHITRIAEIAEGKDLFPTQAQKKKKRR